MKISIIVPTYNEEACIARALAALLALEGDFEVRVADGGSTDRTVEIARGMGVPVVEGARGRGPQMNRGAAGATGEVLLFLHADTLLPPDAYHRVAEALTDPAVAGGCFRLSFDHDHRFLRFSAFLTRFSFRLFHYGDGGYFVRAGIFRELGGYRPYPIMEDLDLWLRLLRAGRTVVVPASVVASARRFRRNGVYRQQLLGVVLVLLFLAGVKPHTLKRFYSEVR
ncbi:MAG TPA: TIGR04283 family arsenosugar biosynthesis glycosyltransferase [Longimicrobiaceae bacterium]|nr:TIGR04283 family arsenosugar biosynthesis glycosyltransferase [Longimicrobiaceae bacterium]